VDLTDLTAAELDELRADAAGTLHLDERAAGRFRIDGLAPGLYTVVAAAVPQNDRGEDTGDPRVASALVEVAPERRTTVTLTLP
jgi:hypothetical protein